jgi:hypothetical protein
LLYEISVGIIGGKTFWEIYKSVQKSDNLDGRIETW